MSYVEEDRGHDTPCWIWQRALTPYGHGQIWREGRLQLAHRVFFEDAGGEVAEDEELDHLCRVPACVRPAHLQPVTHAENCRRGRSAKLTWADVEAIRASADSHVSLAREYGVHWTTIWKARNRWRGAWA